MRSKRARVISLATLPFQPTTGAVVVAAWVIGLYVLLTAAVDLLSQGRTWLMATSVPLIPMLVLLIAVHATRNARR